MTKEVRKMGGKVSFEGNWVPKSVNEDDYSIELIASTGARGMRVPWYDEPYFEELAMGHGNIRLDRFNNGAPLLDNHESQNLNDQIGVVERSWIENGKLHARVRFRSNEKSQEIFNDVKNGVIRNVSVGYKIHEMEESQGDDDEFVTRVATDWEPVELSFVPINFDMHATTRTEKQIGNNVIKVRKKHNNSQETEKMENTENRSAEVKDNNNDGVRNEFLEIMEIGEKFGMQDVAKTFIQNGRSAAELKDEVLNRMGSKSNSRVQPKQNDEIGLTSNEVKRYSVVKALRAQIDNNWKGAEFELEVSNAAKKQFARNTNGFLIPTDVLKRAPAMMVKDQGTEANPLTTGGGLVHQDKPKTYIEMLHDAIVAKKLGAQVLSLRGAVPFPRETSDLDAYWVGEGVAPKSSVITTEQVVVEPKTVGANVDITRALLNQADIAVESYIMRKLTSKIGRKIDEAIFFGTGGKQPLGITNIEGVHHINSGGILSIESIVAMETAVANANAIDGKLAYLTNAKTMGKMKLKLQQEGIPGYLWQSVSRDEGLVNGYPAYYTNMIPSTLGENKDLSALIFGNFASIIIGEFGVLDIEANPWAHHTAGTINIRGLQDCDVGVTHPESFSIIKDIKA